MWQFDVKTNHHSNPGKEILLSPPPFGLSTCLKRHRAGSCLCRQVSPTENGERAAVDRTELLGGVEGVHRFSLLNVEITPLMGS